jgi:hypothetical protein
MKVIFLDVDGLLNTYYTRETFCNFTFVEGEKIQLLKRLVDATGARIVLSSTWSQGFFDMQAGRINTIDTELYIALRSELQNYLLDIMDCTPIIAYNQRGTEIDQWLREWDGEPVKSFVILDDMNGKYMRPHANRLVRTSMREGLQEKHVELAKKILNKPWEGLE